MSRVTIKDIARETGLSVPTVAQILGNRAHLFREETRRRVSEAARRLGYRPNRAAKAMRSGSLGAVLLLNSSAKSYECFYPEMFRALAEELAVGGKHLTVAHLAPRHLQASGAATPLPPLLTDYYADGLLLHYEDSVPPEVAAVIERHSVPVVWLSVRKPTDAVYADFRSTVREAAGRLLAAGHQRIALLQLSHDCEPRYSVPDSRDGFAEATAGRAEAAVLEVPADRLALGCIDTLMAQVLGGPAAPTALVVSGRPLALACYMALLRADIRTPEQISLVAVVDAPLVAPAPELAHYHVDAEALGRQAVQMLLRRIASTEPAAPEPVAFRFAEGTSIGPPTRL